MSSKIFFVVSILERAFFFGRRRQSLSLCCASKRVDRNVCRGSVVSVGLDAFRGDKNLLSVRGGGGGAREEEEEEEIFERMRSFFLLLPKRSRVFFQQERRRKEEEERKNAFNKLWRRKQRFCPPQSYWSLWGCFAKTDEFYHQRTHTHMRRLETTSSISRSRTRKK